MIKVTIINTTIENGEEKIWTESNGNGDFFPSPCAFHQNQQFLPEFGKFLYLFCTDFKATLFFYIFVFL